ncbi:hypothetical protein ACFOLF_12250 [Paenibacillus sepulcri]|uniref:Uncharacterized protein n=1 Tax=Paenibacillus sepulcri TaxID=359917 RepID=A0ABS7BUV9_9BACL|nr:hypothetical protein [Paenibacillus sepulcri]
MARRTRNRRANVDITDDMDLNGLRQRMIELTQQDIHVGMQGDQELAMIAGVHEYGSVKMNIPARSFIGTGKKKAQTAIGKLVRKAVNDIARGERDPGTLFNEIGELALSKMLANFDRIRQPGLSPIYARLKIGNKLLIADDDLRSSLVFKVVERGG